MAAGFSSLVNGGYYYKPHVVKEIQNDAGDLVKEKETEVLRETVSEETSEIIRSYLKETVETGTGKKAQIPGYSIGGKTGTARENTEKQKRLLCFLCRLCAEQNLRNLLIYVTIDEPNVDYQANAGLAVDLERECMEEIVKICGIERTEELTDEEKKALAEKEAQEKEETEKRGRAEKADGYHRKRNPGKTDRYNRKRN